MAWIFGELIGLSRLTIGQGQQGPEEPLRHVAEYAVEAIPGVDGASLALLEADPINTMVAGANFVIEVDALQNGLGEVPASPRRPRPALCIRVS